MGLLSVALTAPQDSQHCAGVCFLDGCPESKGKKLRLGFGAGRGPSCHCWRTAGELICILRHSSVNPGLPAWVGGPAQRGAVNWGCGVEQVSGISDNKDAGIHLGSPSSFASADNMQRTQQPCPGDHPGNLKMELGVQASP